MPDRPAHPPPPPRLLSEPAEVVHALRNVVFMVQLILRDLRENGVDEVRCREAVESMDGQRKVLSELIERASGLLGRSGGEALAGAGVGRVQSSGSSGSGEASGRASGGSLDAPARGRRVLCVDDNRDGADALGLLLEELGCEVHVTYGGATALEVAARFRPDLMFIDLVMPDMDGCGLAARFRQIPAFALTKIVAITGQRDEAHSSSAAKAGFDAVLLKPVTLAEIKAIVASVAPTDAGRRPRRGNERANTPPTAGSQQRLPIDEARRIRNGRASKMLTQAETEAAICDGIIRFQEEYLGWTSEMIRVHFIKDLVVVRVRGALTLAERQLGKSLQPGKGRDMVKQTRKQLLEAARPMLESLVHEVAGVKVVSMHNDLSTVTGEEVVLFSLAGTARFEALTG